MPKQSLDFGVGPIRIVQQNDTLAAVACPRIGWIGMTSALKHCILGAGNDAAQIQLKQRSDSLRISFMPKQFLQFLLWYDVLGHEAIWSAFRKTLERISIGI